MRRQACPCSCGVGQLLLGIHHIAIICSDYELSKQFYENKLDFVIVDENWRAEKQSWKCDLRHGPVQIELFSFPMAPSRPTRPEACGLRHVAFSVDSVEATARLLRARGVEVEPIRIDPHTGRSFTFVADPDGLPIEFYEDRV
ncbi:MULTISPECIES: VOC family protein [unclassified Mesorhizobium]|uniref:SMU1112c/YaeR family gloxylase I-like metalloprotein n=1 Tax=unclassified Mesorhizobium TaxID=325217 RepID=UPI000FCA136C|nr:MULTISPECIES: VOC family protein [unclassified Mesorhizobium]TIT74281.1 MAG: VOC family protein [Mesorhizobium sp.]TGP23865.1 VOC family protein [Mesorhizobium sp. M1D.F.Ca.ET.231.01.1.1]TGP34007.1 VOC family protein [Mesorhizobium sp. M1D.F.Ca.ET.234.01.1.1]TGS47373.1 VOC family protein [Mesorhizobium sp. M1D.F.Ca.ET.184.01.1.1]TGS62634.1 VOC family protein [Mesorhizobium sp. M1D.F.Ca.ET.183.01.1.1]